MDDKEHSQHSAHHAHLKKDNFYLTLLGYGALYLVAALIVFFPLASQMSGSAPGIGGDTYQNLWNIWWINHALSAHSNIYYTNLIFWPVGANLVYQTLAPLYGLASIPFQAISVPFAYNAIFFLAFALSGMTMYVLAEYLTKNKYAAFLAGVIFAFSAAHLALAKSHIEWVNIEWIPLMVFFFIKMLKENDKILSAVGFGISAVLLTFMAGFEQAIMTFVLLSLIFIGYVINKSTRQLFLRPGFWAALIGGGVVALALGFWGFLPVLSSLTQPGGFSNVNYLNSFQNNVLWSDDILSFFLPSYYNAFFTGLAGSVWAAAIGPDPTERTAYFGFVALGLSLYALLNSMKKEPAVILWGAIAAIMILIALGPYLQLAGATTGVPMPYQLYHSLPIISIVREPGRFDIMVMLAVAILSAFGMKALLEKHHADKGIFSNKMLVVGGLAMIFLVESAGLPVSAMLTAQTVTQISVPPLYPQLGALNTSSSYSILSLPALPNQNSALPAYFTGRAMYYTSFTNHPLIGGYQSRENASQQLTIFNIPLAVQASTILENGKPSFFTPIIESLDNQTVMAFYNYNTQFVILNKDAYNLTTRTSLMNHLAFQFGKPVYNDSTTAAFQTTNAITNNTFKSFVAFPILTEWQQAQVNVSNTPTVIWIPINPGAVLVYAPYPYVPSVTSANSTSALSAYTVNAVINFKAMGAPGSQIIIEQRNDSGALSELGIINITSASALNQYSLNVTMLSGPRGNTYFFVPAFHGASIAGLSTQSVGTSGIWFTRRR